MYFLAMHVAHKPFDNKLVRQAISYAVDPAAVIKFIYEGNGYVMNGPVGSNVIGYDPKVKRYPFDPKRAKELLSAGYPNGLEVKLYFSPDRYPEAREVCQVIADQLLKAGVKTELVSQEFVVFWGKEGVNGGKLPFYYVGRPAIDADTVYDQYFRSGTTKRVEYKNPEVDKLIDEEQRTGDPKKRAALTTGEPDFDGGRGIGAVVHSQNSTVSREMDLESQTRRENSKRRNEDSLETVHA